MKNNFFENIKNKNLIEEDVEINLSENIENENLEIPEIEILEKDIKNNFEESIENENLEKNILEKIEINISKNNFYINKIIKKIENFKDKLEDFEVKLNNIENILDDLMPYSFNKIKNKNNNSKFIKINNNNKLAQKLIDENLDNLDFIDKNLFQNLDFIKYLISKFEDELYNLIPYIENIENIEVIKYILSKNPDFYKNLKSSFLKNEELFEFICNLKPENIEYTNDSVFENTELLKKILKNNGKVLKYLPYHLRSEFRFDVPEEYIFLTQTELSKREKWNKKKIYDFFKQPDKIINSRFNSGTAKTIYLFNLAKIKEFENSIEFLNYENKKK